MGSRLLLYVSDVKLSTPGDSSRKTLCVTKVEKSESDLWRVDRPRSICDVVLAKGLNRKKRKMLEEDENFYVVKNVTSSSESSSFRMLVGGVMKCSIIFGGVMAVYIGLKMA